MNNKLFQGHILNIIIPLFLVFNILTARPGKTYLNKISSHYLELIPFALRFSVKTMDEQENILSRATGDFIINSKNSFRVNYPEEEILYDGQWLWSYNQVTEQVVVEPFDPTSSLNLIYDVINGKLGAYQIIKDRLDEKHHHIFLKPEDKNNFFTEIKIIAYRDTSLIDLLKYVDFQKNQILIDFLRIKDTVICDSAFYNIKDLKGKEIIDLRP